MHDTPRQTYYWPHSSKYVYVTVGQSAGYTWNGSQYNHKRLIQLLPAKRTFRVRRDGPLWSTTKNPSRKPVRAGRHGSLLQIIVRYTNIKDYIFTFRESVSRSLDNPIRNSHLSPYAQWSTVCEKVLPFWQQTTKFRAPYNHTLPTTN